VSELTDRAAAALTAVGDPKTAVAMAAYLKTDMAVYGVKRPERRPIERALAAEFPPADADDYRRNVLELWRLEHREEKYLALSYARAFRQWIEPDQLTLFEQLIREGAWWDLVDETATKLVGPVVLDHHDEVRLLLYRWIDDSDLWIRRSAIICQLGHKIETDPTMLFDFCGRRMHETEFFIRKAIGWALRDYAKTDPESVRSWVADHFDDLSGLSRREALKHLR